MKSEWQMVNGNGKSSDESSVYILNPAVAIEDFGERSLALHCTELRMVELNATARDIARRLDGKSNLDQLAHVLANEYNQPLETIQADVQALIEQMAEMGIVEQVSPTNAEINPRSSVSQ